MSFDDGFILGVNLGRKQAQGTGANGAFRAVWDNNAGILTIVVQEGEKYADYQFGYEFTEWSDEITTQTVVKGEKVKTTRSFSKRIVTLLYDASGVVLLVTDYNADNGAILGYTDGSGEVVHTAEWRSEYESVVTQSQGASSAAVAWCVARNLEQSASLIEEKQAYKDGLKIGVEGGADITEEYTKDGNGISLTTDGDGGVSEPFIGNLTDGIYCVAADGSYVRMWVDMSYSNINGQGCLTYDAYDANGNLIQTTQCLSDGNWPWFHSVGRLNYHVKWVTIDFSKSIRYAVWTRWQDNEGDTASGYWDYPKGEAYSNLRNTVRITNIPPEVIN